MILAPLTILLTRGHETTISPEDLALAGRLWHAEVDPDGRVYAVGREEGRLSKLHRVIARAKPGEVVDHIDGDTLNNQRDNLRIVTTGENNRNLGGARKDSSTGLLGVYPTPYGRYKAAIRHQGKLHWLGTYATPEEAQQVRLAKEREFWGVQPRRAHLHG